MARAGGEAWGQRTAEVGSALLATCTSQATTVAWGFQSLGFQPARPWISTSRFVSLPIGQEKLSSGFHQVGSRVLAALPVGTLSSWPLRALVVPPPTTTPTHPPTLNAFSGSVVCRVSSVVLLWFVVSFYFGMLRRCEEGTRACQLYTDLWWAATPLGSLTPCYRLE